MTQSTSSTPSLYDTLGGEPAVRGIINTFVDRMVADIMIGFFFAKVDIVRLKQLEFEHAAAFLGAPIIYSGRPLDAAHRRHNIMGGQFARRKQILKEVLEAHQVPDDIRAAWLAHVESLRPEITQAKDGSCLS